MRRSFGFAWFALGFALAGCKFGFTSSAIKEGEQAASVSNEIQFPVRNIAYHGVQAELSQNQLVAFNDPLPTVDAVGVPGLGTDTQTLIAGTDPNSTINGDFFNGDTINGDPASPTAGDELSGFALAGGVTPYMQQCEKEGVPLPPAWGDPAWVNRGEMKTLLTLQGRRTVLWTADLPNGTCAALPRQDGAGNITFMGMICVAQASGKTCFFDNVQDKVEVDASGQRFQPKIIVKNGYDASDALGADKLLENCSECHRGDNPWIITPGEPTSKKDPNSKKAFLPNPSALYAPVGPAGWVNATPGKQAAQCAEGCHVIPELTGAYCGIAEYAVQNFIMPQGATAGDPFDDATKAFLVECAKIP